MNFNSCRIFLVLSLVSFPLLLLGQYNFLKHQDSQMFYERVFPADSISYLEMQNFIFDGLSKYNGITNITNSHASISAKFVDTYINYKKYGGKWANTITYLNHPFYADISVQWREGRYKVTVNNMFFRTNTPLFGDVKCSDIFVKEGNWQTNKIILTSGGYIEKYLNEIFTFKNSGTNW